MAFWLILALFGVNPHGSRSAITRQGPRDGLTYVHIQPGSFPMGDSRADTPRNEHPAHMVSISRGFWLSTTEVTVGAYKRFAATTGRAMPPDSAEGLVVNRAWADDGQPIVNVTWAEADSFCRWAGGNLPTEAEWEYAARAGADLDPYGPLDEIAWTARNSGRALIDADSLFRADKLHYEEALVANGNHPHAVGGKAPNGFGLYDMIGNVCEWTQDWADPTYYEHSPGADPSGPDSGQARVARGGHFLYPSPPSRAAKRLWSDPLERSPIMGFRVLVRDAR